VVANYFVQEEDQNKSIFPFTRDWRNFMNTRKEDFSQWKKSSQLIHLKLPVAETFYRSSKLQAKIFQCVEIPREQVEVKLNYTFDYLLQLNDIVDLQLIPEVKRIYIGGVDKVSFGSTVAVENLEIVGGTFKNFSFSMLSTVSRSTFHDYKDNATTTYDFALLKGLTNGSFHFDRCVNYHYLSHLQSLEITSCSSITDVSCFKNIPKLKLFSCQNITDVGSLGSVSELDLSYCRRVVDVSKLGKVRILKLRGCTGIVDVSALNNVHTLDISRCDQFTDISGLKSVTVLDISGCSRIKSVAMLVTLKELNIADCGKVHDLDDLVHLQVLTVTGMRQVTATNLSIISKLRHVTIYNNKMVKNGGDAVGFMSDETVAPLKNISSLSFVNDSTLVSLPYFTYLRSLTISGCENFTSLPYLPALSHLEISHMFELRSFDLWGDDSSNLQPIYDLKIFLCPRLKRVSIRRKVFRNRITFCYDLQLLEVFNQIDLLVMRNHQETCSVIVNNTLIVCFDYFSITRSTRTYLSNVTNDVILKPTPLEAIADVVGEFLPRNICRLV
jgi:hypothetical protein